MAGNLLKLRALDEQELSPERGWTCTNRFSNSNQFKIETSPTSGGSSTGSMGENSKSINTNLALRNLLQQKIQKSAEAVQMEAQEGSEEVMLVDQTTESSQNSGASNLVTTVGQQLQFQAGNQVISLPISAVSQYNLSPGLFSSPDQQQVVFQSDIPMEYTQSSQNEESAANSLVESLIQMSQGDDSSSNVSQENLLNQLVSQQQTIVSAEQSQDQNSTNQYQYHIQQQLAPCEDQLSVSTVASNVLSVSSQGSLSEQSLVVNTSYPSPNQLSSGSPVFMTTASSVQQSMQSPGMSMIREYEAASPSVHDSVSNSPLTVSSPAGEDSPVFGTHPNISHQGVIPSPSLSQGSQSEPSLRQTYRVQHTMVSPQQQQQQQHHLISATTKQRLLTPRQPNQTNTSNQTQLVNIQHNETLSSNMTIMPRSVQQRQMQRVNPQTETESSVLARGTGFQKGYVYYIKKPNGEGGFLAKYTDEGLVKVDQVKVEGQQSAAGIIGGGRGGPVKCRGRGQGQTRGRGRGQTSAQQLKGNATGLHMSSSGSGFSSFSKGSVGSHGLSNSESNPLCQTNSPQHILPNGRIWHHARPDTTSLARPPLHPEGRGPHGSQSTGEVSVSSSTSGRSLLRDTPKTVSEADSTSLENLQVPPSPPKPKKPSGADGYTLCKFCGYISGDIEQCERCSRKFTGSQKIIKTLEKTLDKKSFYSSKLREQSKPYDRPGSRQTANSRGSSSPIHAGAQGVKGNGSRKQVLATTVSNSRTRGRKPWHEPETVTISSSDEEDGSGSFRCLKNQTWSPGQDSQDHTFVAPKIPTRRELMEDQYGRCSAGKRGRRGRGYDSAVLRAAALKQKCNDLSVELNVRSVRIGSMKSTPLEHVTISREGFQFHVTCDESESELQFDVHAEEIEHCKVFLKAPQPIMFLSTHTTCAVRLQEELGMDSAVDMVYNPESDDLTQKFIVIIINKIEEYERTDITCLFNHYKKMTGCLSPLLSHCTADDANVLLVKTTPRKNEAIHQLCDKVMSSVKERESMSSNKDDGEASEESRSPSPPPKIGFTGPIEKLLTYPPPPSKGGISITNEDVYCLNEGEFLNDVIIDFYLKYLFNEKLNEVDKKRTHIFSSFFYKRLTQRQPRNSVPSDIAKQPAMIKRHTRVKTWTRHVDLFEKDFIVVPINEHSHWFLAIICFPNLNEPEHVPYIPRKPDSEDGEKNEEEETADDHSKTEQDKESDEKKGETSMESEDSEKIPAPVTTNTNQEIRGTALDSKEILESDDNNKDYNLGVKQACILVFDSLAGPSRQTIVRILKEYLQVEWDTKKQEKRAVKDVFQGDIVKVPQQTNYSDCGVYLLQYVESFFEDPVMDFSLPMKSLKKWFKDEIVSTKRERIRDLIMDLKKKEEDANAAAATSAASS